MFFFRENEVYCSQRRKTGEMTREEKAMKIKFNPDEEIVKTVQEGLKHTGGYCPCRRERTEENRCMCREFREQIADPSFEGFCHCMLYYKSLEE